MIINKEFYNRSAVDVAKDLLGKVLVREVDGKILKGKIVETEDYMGRVVYLIFILYMVYIIVLMLLQERKMLLKQF